LEREQEGWRQVLEGERRRVLEEARAQADSIVADARGEAERLQSHGEQLRSLLADSRQRFVALAESALRQLEDVDRTRRGPDEREVLDDLRPATSARD
jgi:F0F1-type ATP synthase membrane subunit b/b'